MQYIRAFQSTDLRQQCYLNFLHHFRGACPFNPKVPDSDAWALNCGDIRGSTIRHYVWHSPRHVIQTPQAPLVVHCEIVAVKISSIAHPVHSRIVSPSSSMQIDNGQTPTMADFTFPLVPEQGLGKIALFLSVHGGLHKIAHYF